MSPLARPTDGPGTPAQPTEDLPGRRKDAWKALSVLLREVEARTAYARRTGEPLARALKRGVV
ncbi:hypothetical protein ACFTWS_17820 [Streptomyces sp. NPDC057027]|uniref:hypothetical protein n=1 Tax=Streptomyces sp. NPDC057027 TaxID=3346004 RepID=UPI0036364E55